MRFRSVRSHASVFLAASSFSALRTLQGLPGVLEERPHIAPNEVF
jgi:hypothetical protein